MSEMLVCAENLARSYGRGENEVIALRSATCAIAPGQRIAVVGPSGSGKSTLLALLGGLDQPSSGKVWWPALGERNTLRPQKVALVFQSPSLLPPLTVVENVELPLLLGKQGAATARAAAHDALAQLELDDLADKLPEELSGGQAQRVALARALAYRPQLILADEPTGQLDHATARHLFDVLLASLEGSDTALLIATHDLEVAARMMQRWQIDHGVMEVPR
ncbi:MAG: ABC transporter ATP-binding protein [Candidatus Chloroheliales bacterium]|nr:MAG: ABC transporter ATP-binding protein [Chloroflexota bacterium]